MRNPFRSHEASLYIRRDGSVALAAPNREHLQIWDAQTFTLIEHPPIPEFFAISQKGTVLLSRNAGRIEVWDGRVLLPVKSRGKRIVEWGQVKQNRLLQNYPNPFTPETWIPFQLANESAVTIRIYAQQAKSFVLCPWGTYPQVTIPPGRKLFIGMDRMS